jgi:hypothetical protein
MKHQEMVDSQRTEQQADDHRKWLALNAWACAGLLLRWRRWPAAAEMVTMAIRRTLVAVWGSMVDIDEDVPDEAVEAFYVKYPHMRPSKDD